MKTKLLAGFLLAGSCLFAAPRIAVGIGVGVGVPVGGYGYYAPGPAYVAPAYLAPAYVPPPVPVAVAAYRGPGAWVGGYWYGYGPHRVWRPGYWAPRGAYFGARARFRR